MVRRWAKDWGEGALVEAALLQVDAPDVLAALFADPELRAHLQRLPGAPTLAVVRRESIDRVRTTLSARGMTLGDRLRSS